MRMESNVYVGRVNSEEIVYPNADDYFSPDQLYPEYPFQTLSYTPNQVYDLICDGFYKLDFDKNNYGLKCWNLHSCIIHTGDTVVLKLNMVRDKNGKREYWNI